MTVPPNALAVLQWFAIARAEGLRHHEIPPINQALDACADTYCSSNAALTGRERICRLANQLEAIKATVPVEIQIEEIVVRLRRAFGLQENLEQSTTYGLVTALVNELSRKYPAYDISRKLRTSQRFLGVRTVEDTKAAAASMITELLVIGMNADAEGFRNDLKQTIQKMTEIMLTWM